MWTTLHWQENPDRAQALLEGVDQGESLKLKERMHQMPKPVFVIASDGAAVMPTSATKARKLLKAKKAIIVGYMPFAIQLTHQSGHNTQPVEICIDTGSEHIGVSVKSEKHEYFHAQFDNLKDEKQRHEARAMYRRTRRNRLRYRKPRFNNRGIPEGWLAPTVKHKKDNHINLISKLVKLLPTRDIHIEVAQFDTHLMQALEQGVKLEGEDYQRGLKYGLANTREAVFVRDNYTCQCCGKSVKDGVILHAHHVIHRSDGGSDSVSNLLTVCNKCHTTKNHRPGGKLDGLKPKNLSLKDASFMNIVRWHIVNELKENFPSISIHTTYGSYTKASRRILGQIEKSHANDSYAMGEFHPKHRAHEVILKKHRRNNRVLSKFYDAKYIDLRTGEIKSGSELGCNRTNRSIPRNNSSNERIFRSERVSKGRVSIKSKRHTVQSGDKVVYKGKKYTSQGTLNLGATILLETAKQSKTGKALTCSTSKTKITSHIGGWIHG